ncbi:hypothetical protein FHX37_1092 [Haloactinospora alba]|uniref:RanBP2-type domain-containing protein n=1 Tax=Haloactinospora alba TaxID=405555 RepID=A0A543NH77_9ACTN|nr:hypothetical protein FHX37_1092 [Haloactinospora alba]
MWKAAVNWVCSRCGINNPKDHTACGMCGTARGY